jgi:uncharacterized DUF497 family protein
MNMEFEWMDRHALIGDVSEKDVEECFEDPFSIRLLPDLDSSKEARYFILGKSISGTPLFTVFWTDGKRYRVIISRPMTEAEAGFYERKNSDPAN